MVTLDHDRDHGNTGSPCLPQDNESERRERNKQQRFSGLVCPSERESFFSFIVFLAELFLPGAPLFTSGKMVNDRLSRSGAETCTEGACFWGSQSCQHQSDTNNSVTCTSNTTTTASRLPIPAATKHVALQ